MTFITSFFLWAVIIVTVGLCAKLVEKENNDKKTTEQKEKTIPKTTPHRPINTYSSTILRKYLNDKEEEELELEEEEREENPWWEIEREEEEIEDEKAEREKEEEEELLRLEEEEEFGTQDEGEW